MARSKLCTMENCNRPADKASPEGRLCTPCLTEAEWENTHSDNGHETANGGEPEVMACWICHPELNEASATYSPRKGVSRKGQVMHVGPRDTAAEKAATVKSSLAEIGWTATVSKRNGITALQIKTAGLRLSWDPQGRYLYGESVYGDRKLRNVSEALRILAGVQEG